jgi:hypothetical protein
MMVKLISQSMRMKTEATGVGDSTSCSHVWAMLSVLVMFGASRTSATGMEEVGNMTSDTAI